MIACKLLCVALAAVCASQAMGTPAQQAKGVKAFPERELDLPVHKGLLADIDAAIDAIYALQDSIDALKTQINNSITVITVDTALQIRDIMKQIMDLGISPEEVAAAEAAINQNFANIEAIFTGILDDLNSIVALLGQILTDLGNLHLIDMYKHIQDLTAAFDKLEADVSTIYSRVAAEFTSIFQTIINLTLGEPVEIVQQITDDLVNIGNTWVSEATKMWTSFETVLEKASATLTALWAIVSKQNLVHKF